MGIKTIDNNLLKPTLMWGTTPLYNNKDALLLLNYYSNNNIGILGFEGFIKLDDGFMPDMDCIVDFSDFFLNDSQNFVKKSIEITHNFLQSVSDDILFEFVTAPMPQK